VGCEPEPEFEDPQPGRKSSESNGKHSNKRLTEFLLSEVAASARLATYVAATKLVT